MLLADMPVVNIYEHYRDHGWPDAEPTRSAPTPPVRGAAACR